MKRIPTIKNNPTIPLKINHKIVGENENGIIMEVPMDEYARDSDRWKNCVCRCCKYWGNNDCGHPLHGSSVSCISVITMRQYYK